MPPRPYSFAGGPRVATAVFQALNDNRDLQDQQAAAAVAKQKADALATAATQETARRRAIEEANFQIGLLDKGVDVRDPSAPVGPGEEAVATVPFAGGPRALVWHDPKYAATRKQQSAFTALQAKYPERYRDFSAEHDYTKDTAREDKIDTMDRILQSSGVSFKTPQARRAYAEINADNPEWSKQIDAMMLPPTDQGGTWSISDRTDPASGQTRPIRINAKTGEAHWIDDVGAKPGTSDGGGGGGGIMGGLAQARRAGMLAAMSEARLADERMRKYEDKLISGSAKINPLKQAAGSLTTNLADSKSVPGVVTQSLSEFGLGVTDPDYQQYLRDAATIARAEQLASPGSKSEAMARAAALLSRGAGGAQGDAMASSIDAARKTRQAFFGRSGGISQALTPEQMQKLEAGVETIRAGDTGVAPGVSAGNPFAHLIPPATTPRRRQDD